MLTTVQFWARLAYVHDAKICWVSGLVRQVQQAIKHEQIT